MWKTNGTGVFTAVKWYVRYIYGYTKNVLQCQSAESPRSSCTAVLANLSLCLTSINVRMVSGFKLARRREMVSRPPEKICSTATAEPRVTNQYCTIISTNGEVNRVLPPIYPLQVARDWGTAFDGHTIIVWDHRCWNILIVRVSSLWQCYTNRNKLLVTSSCLVVFRALSHYFSRFLWSAVRILQQQVPKFSCGNLKYSSSSSISVRVNLLYRERKSTFWGDPFCNVVEVGWVWRGAGDFLA